MKIVLIVLALVAAVVALPRPDAPVVPAPVISRTEVRDLQGQFTLDYRSADGTKVTEEGKLVPNADQTDQVLVKSGTFSYISPEGQLFTVTYVADENGFRPVGAHIPV